MKLFTIAIPTYNRSRYLELCLTQLCKQLHGNEQNVDILVSDNASTDNTGEIVDAFISRGFPISYVKNDTNIGADANIAQAFSLATAKYVLVLADDDVLVDGALKKIIGILQEGDFGIVHVRAYPYQTDFVAEFPKKNTNADVMTYDDVKRFIKKVNYSFTFISGNIVNKTLVDKTLNIQEFMNTNMIQLTWTFSALFNAKKNVYVGQYLVAAKGGNTGGYQLCRVFGLQVNTVFNFFISRGVKKAYFDIINRKLLFSFFPFFIRGLRRVKEAKFHEEDYYSALYPVFGNYINFWLFTLPSITLPLPLVSFLLFAIRELMKIALFYDKLRAFFDKRHAGESVMQYEEHGK